MFDTILSKIEISLLINMSSTSENMPTTESKRKSATKSAPRKEGGSRQPGRPHKRLAADVLSARTSVLTCFDQEAASAYGQSHRHTPQNMRRASILYTVFLDRQAPSAKGPLP